MVNRSRDFFLRIKHFSETRNFNKDNIDADDMPKTCDGAYKTYNERDLEQLKRLFKAAKDNRVIEGLNPEVFCSLFIGYSIFSISHRQSVLNAIEDQLMNEEFTQESNEKGEQQAR